MAWKSNKTVVKENVFNPYPLQVRWILVALVYVITIYVLAFVQDSSLPPPKMKEGSKPDEFVAENAMEYLVNLTSIGPRVAGSYENEVLAKLTLTASLHAIKAAANPDVRFDIDVFSSSGQFSLSFFDGMNSIYNNVTNIVARAAPKIETRPPKAAILLNCHTDTVSDSPGASDDAAGCAVALEALRALVSGPPLRRPVLLLLNAAEENIMQGSHAFVTTHPWAKTARTFINLEACGTGGREVLFQAGPNDPWLLDLYSRVVPAPLATSVAQELFESGLIPADTDFRIFRDFANLSGLDFAWSSNGWVYHTGLDTAERVPLGALQRSGDNVLSLLKGLQLATEADRPVSTAALPVFFDVFGTWVVVLSPAQAAPLAGLLLALLLLRVELHARNAASQLYINRKTWWRLTLNTAFAALSGVASGILFAVFTGYLLYFLDAQMPYYSQLWLILPLFVIPSFTVFVLVVKSWCKENIVFARGFWSAVLGLDALAVLTGLVLLIGALLRLRSALVPAIWCVPHALLVPFALYERAVNRQLSPAVRYVTWAVLCSVPMYQSASLSVGWIHMILPILGRSGTGRPPADALLALTLSALLLPALASLLPLLLAVPAPRGLRRIVAGVWLAAIVISLVAGFPYSPERPARYMVFHTQRTFHWPDRNETESWYWIPHLDPSTPKHILPYVPELGSLSPSSGDSCRTLAYCGAPYYLPVLKLVGAGHWGRARTPPAPQAALRAELRLAQLHDAAHELQINMTGPSHIVVMIVAPEHGLVKECGSTPVLQAADTGTRRTAFFLIHDGSGRTKHMLRCTVAHSPFYPVVVDVSIAGHAMCGPGRLTREHAALLARFPAWAAPTGWGVDMHYHRLHGAPHIVRTHTHA